MLYRSGLRRCPPAVALHGGGKAASSISEMTAVAWVVMQPSRRQAPLGLPRSRRFMAAVEHLEQRSLRRAPNLVLLNSGASQGAVEGWCGSEDNWPLAKVLKSSGGYPPAADAE